MSSAIALTVVPKRAAMAESVSPARTRYVRYVPVGDGEGEPAALGLGEAAGEDVGRGLGETAEVGVANGPIEGEAGDGGVDAAAVPG